MSIETYSFEGQGVIQGCWFHIKFDSETLELLDAESDHGDLPEPRGVCIHKIMQERLDEHLYKAGRKQ